MPSRQPPDAADLRREHQARRKLADLVKAQRYRDALRVREQALRRHPDLELSPSEAQLWFLLGQQGVACEDFKSAEGSFNKSIALGLQGEPHYQLAKLWLQQRQPQRGLQLFQQAFESGSLPSSHAGAYLKLLLINGQTPRVRELLQQQPERFQPQQRQWAAGILNLLEGNLSQAKRQFRQMAGPASPGDHSAIWRAWTDLEEGNVAAAVAALKEVKHPAAAALALDLCARTERQPGELLDLDRGDLPRRPLALALELLHQLHQQNWMAAGLLLLEHERPMLNAVPALASLRRPLLSLAGQQALERESPHRAIRFWQAIVHQPTLDAELALRLYPLLDQSDDEDSSQDAERLASQLLSWLRREARDNPTAWPQPLLNSCLARLHCWQADQQMRMGMRQQARRSVDQARQLAPDLPDVIGRQGMFAQTGGDSDKGIPLLWRALDSGCRSQNVYDVLVAGLELTGQSAERLRLQRQYGALFDDEPEPDPHSGAIPAWLEALSGNDVMDMYGVLRSTSQSGPALQVLHLFSDQVSAQLCDPDGVNYKKVRLDLPKIAPRWDALVESLEPLEQVEALSAIVAVILRFTARSSTAMRSQIAARLAALEALAADPAADGNVRSRALQHQLLLAGLRLRRSEQLVQESTRLLRRSHQPERILARALLDLRMLMTTKPWLSIAEDLHRQAPEDALLVLALATMQRLFSDPYRQLADQAFELARSQQDSETLAACRREREWAETSFDRKLSRRRLPSSQSGGLDFESMFDHASLGELFQNLAKSRAEQKSGKRPPRGRSRPGAGAAAGYGDFNIFKLFNMMGLNFQMDDDDDEDDDEDSQGDGGRPLRPPPSKQRRSQRRTFMDL